MRCLIIRNDKIGDLISTSMIVPKLKYMFGKKITKIDLICSSYGYKYACLLSKSDISNVFINERDLSPINDLKLINKLRKNNYDVCISLSPNNKSFLLNILSKSKLKASVRILKKDNKSKPSSFISKYLDVFLDIENNKDYRNLTWSDFYSQLCVDIHKRISNNVYSKKNKFPSTYLKPIIKYNLNKQSIRNFVVFHIDEKWELSRIKRRFLLDIIVEVSKSKKVLITTNYYKTKINYNLDNDLGFISRKKIIDKSIIFKNIYSLNRLKKDNSSSYLSKLIQCISLSKCVIQIHGGIGHYAGSLNKNIINLKIKKQNLQKLYKIQTKGSYIDLYLKNSQKFKNSVINYLNKQTS